MSDNLYNPDNMSKEDIKALFVARKPLLDKLVNTIKHQPTGAGVQHMLMIAPRGMGKTTMLLMLQFAIEDTKELRAKWQPVRFPEENYGITDLADLWIKVAAYLNDENLTAQVKEVEKRYRDAKELREAVWALIKDWCKKHKKRIALLLDNFDQILEQIGDDTEQARLRDILMNDGTVMLIGCAPSYFQDITDHDKPLFNFFEVSKLNDLKFEDIENLLRKRAEVDETENFEEILRNNESRIRALEAFTGGNPRLVLMLYRIITNSDFGEVKLALEKLLDDVTPYYKDKTEKLPPQQRKIIDQISQYALETSEAVSPTEIARRTRMTPNQVSAQLKRLSENGYVRAVNIRGRSSYYVLSEPLYVIWSQMRFGRNAREKRGWLVQMLKALYDARKIRREISKLEKRIGRFKADGRDRKALGTLEFMMCLFEAFPGQIARHLDTVIMGYLELGEKASVKAELRPERLAFISEELQDTLIEKGYVQEEDINKAKFKQKLDEMLNWIENEIKNGKVHNLMERLRGLTEHIEKPDLNSLDSLEPQALLNPATIYVRASVTYLAALDLLENSLYEEAHEALSYTLRILGKFETKEERFGELALNVCSFRAFAFFYENKLNDVGVAFEEMIQTSKDYYSENWLREIIANMLDMPLALLFYLRQFTEASIYKEDFFEFNLAMEYLESKDEAVIEKLSPDVRVVVEEIVRMAEEAQAVLASYKGNAKKKRNKKSKGVTPILQADYRFVRSITFNN